MEARPQPAHAIGAPSGAARETVLVVDPLGAIRLASNLPGATDALPRPPHLTLEHVFGDDAVALRPLVAELSRSAITAPDARARLHVTPAAGGGWADVTIARCDDVGGPAVMVRWSRATDAGTAAGPTNELGERLRGLLGYTQDTLLVLDAVGRIVDAFGSHERVAGYSREQLVGRFALSLLHERDRVEAGFRLVWHVLDPRRAGRFAFEARVRAADGEYRWAEFIAANRFDDPFVRGIVVTARHLTPVKDIEASMHATERQLETALWASRAAYWTIDVATDRAEVGPQFFALTGIDPHEWARDADPWNSRMHPDDLPRARAIYDEFIAGTRELYESEYRLRTPAGWLWLHDRGRVVERDSNGRPTRIAGTSLDATSRKALEQAVADAAMHERRRLSGDLHDGLGQELAGISFMLGSLVRDLVTAQSPFTGEARRILEFVQGTIATTRSLAHGLLPENFDDGGLTPSLRRLASDLSRGLGIYVSFSVVDPGEALTRLPTDRMQQLYHICQEAIANAHRHGAARHIDVSVRVTADGLELAIDDDGSGIETAVERNTGIGLRIMAYRAQLLGGRLDVLPRPGGGTRVTVRCPAVSRFAGDPALT